MHRGDAYSASDSSNGVRAADVQDQDLPAEFAEALAWTGTEELVGVIAHDLANVLGIILNYAAFVAEGVPADCRAAEDAREIVKGSRESAVLVRQLGLLSASARSGVEVVAVGTLVRDLEPLLRRGFGARAHLRVEIDDDLPDVRIDRGALARAMLALVLARLDELDEGATLELRLRVDNERRCVLLVMQGAAVTFDPIRAGGRGLAAVAGARLEGISTPPGHAALSLAVPIGGG